MVLLTRLRPKRWRVALVRAGADFHKGKPVERPTQITQRDPIREEAVVGAVSSTSFGSVTSSRDETLPSPPDQRRRKNDTVVSCRWYHRTLDTNVRQIAVDTT